MLIDQLRHIIRPDLSRRSQVANPRKFRSVLRVEQLERRDAPSASRLRDPDELFGDVLGDDISDVLSDALRAPRRHKHDLSDGLDLSAIPGGTGSPGAAQAVSQPVSAAQPPAPAAGGAQATTGGAVSPSLPMPSLQISARKSQAALAGSHRPGGGVSPMDDVTITMDATFNGQEMTGDGRNYVPVNANDDNGTINPAT